MKRAILNGTHESLKRIFATLKHFVGENRVYKLGDMLFVSTRNNEDYDVVLYPDGKKTFLQLWADKDKQPQPSGGGELGPNTVGTDEIIDGSIKMEDLSDAVKDEIRRTYDESEESMHMGGSGIEYGNTEQNDDPSSLLI